MSGVAGPAGVLDSGGVRWSVLQPRADGPWPGVGHDDTGARVWGLVDPETGEVEPADPWTDPRLPGLGRWRNDATLVGYRPGRRAVLRVDGPTTRWVKVVRPRRLASTLERHRQVESLGTVAVPPVLDHRADEGWFVLGNLDGTCLHDQLVAGLPAPALARFEAAFAGLWSARPPERVAADPGPEALLAATARVDPALADELTARLARLPEPPPTAGCRHGDLHDKNIVTLPDGRLGLLDLDGFGAGCPDVDRGNLVAHLELRALQRTGHPAPAPSGLTEQVDRHRRRTFVRLAAIYRFRRRWTALAPVLAALAEAGDPVGQATEPAC